MRTKGVIYIAGYDEQGSFGYKKYPIANFVEELGISTDYGDYFHIKGLGRLLVKDVYTIGDNTVGFRCRKIGEYE